MSTRSTKEKLEQELSKLSGADLLALHERLIRRIHAAAEAEGLDPTFQDDIRRRLAEIEAGTVKGVDAFEALETM